MRTVTAPAPTCPACLLRAPILLHSTVTIAVPALDPVPRLPPYFLPSFFYLVLLFQTFPLPFSPRLTLLLPITSSLPFPSHTHRINTLTHTLHKYITPTSHSYLSLLPLLLSLLHSLLHHLHCHARLLTIVVQLRHLISLGRQPSTHSSVHPRAHRLRYPQPEHRSTLAPPTRPVHRHVATRVNDTPGIRLI